jgi:hypothetical protein
MLEQARRELDKPKRGAIYKEAETAMAGGHADPPLLLLKHSQPYDEEGPGLRTAPVLQLGGPVRAPDDRLILAWSRIGAPFLGKKDAGSKAHEAGCPHARTALP